MQIKQPILIILFIGILFQLSAQRLEYDLTYKKDIPLTIGALGLILTSHFLDKKDAPLTDLQLNALNRESIWKLDRRATYQWSPKAATASDIFMLTSLVSPVALLANENARKEYYVSAIYLESFLITAALTNFTKVITKRNRPYTYNSNAPIEKKKHLDARRSFFSGHTSMTAMSSFFIAKTYADLNRGSKGIPYVWTSAAIVPAITGLLRYKAGKHFPTDIFVGYLIGTAVGILVPHLHKSL